MIPHSSPWITAEDRQSVSERLNSGMIARGEAVARFERAVQERIGAAATQVFASGADAVAAALRSLGVGPGDQVVMPTYVCDTLLHAVHSVGAEPSLADVGEDANLTVNTVAAAMSPNVRAIVAVHTFGHPCRINALRSFGVPIVEDACQAFGLTTPEGVAGMLADVGVFSFQATKFLTTGEGGMVVWPRATAEREAQVIHRLSSISDLQAALGLSQLARYGDFVARRASIRRHYEQAVSGRPELISHQPDSNPLFRFTLRSEREFDVAADFFSQHGIAVRRGVDDLLHRRLGVPDSRFPVAAHLFRTTCSIPFYPALTDAEVEEIAHATMAFADAH